MNPPLPFALWTYVLFAGIYTSTSALAPYPLSPLVKVFPILILIALAFHVLKDKIRILTLFALSFSALGDVLLALEFENNFIAGLAAFLVAHIFYVVIFRQFFNVQHKRIKLGLCLAVISFCILMATMVLPHEPVLRIAVICYIAVITLMCCTAVFSVHSTYWMEGYWLAVSGAVIFAVSDSIIAWDAFRTSVPNASVWIMTTYYLAQALILLGIIRLSGQFKMTGICILR